MSTVVCSRCGEMKEAVGTVPLPGALGESVAAHVCQDCWQEWIQTSIRVVNHYKLQPALREHREKLFELMVDFLKLPAEAQARESEGS